VCKSYLEIILGLEHGGVDGPNCPAHEHHAGVAELKEHNFSKIWRESLFVELSNLTITDSWA
jgi:hypothetical protein